MGVDGLHSAASPGHELLLLLAACGRLLGITPRLEVHTPRDGGAKGRLCCGCRRECLLLLALQRPPVWAMAISLSPKRECTSATKPLPQSVCAEPGKERRETIAPNAKARGFWCVCWLSARAMEVRPTLFNEVAFMGPLGLLMSGSVLAYNLAHNTA